MIYLFVKYSLLLAM